MDGVLCSALIPIPPFFMDNTIAFHHMHIPYKHIGTLPELSGIPPFESPPSQIQYQLCTGSRELRGESGKANVTIPSLLAPKSSDIMMNLITSITCAHAIEVNSHLRNEPLCEWPM